MKSYCDSLYLGCSNFSDVFDVNYFIESLRNDVPVVEKLPLSLTNEPKVIKQFKSWSNVKYYEEDMGRLWHHYKVHASRSLPFSHSVFTKCSKTCSIWRS